jgi:hypothetical protein
MRCKGGGKVGNDFLRGVLGEEIGEGITVWGECMG